MDLAWLWWIQLAIPLIVSYQNHLAWSIHPIFQLPALMLSMDVFSVKHYQFPLFGRLNWFPLFVVLFFHSFDGYSELLTQPHMDGCRILTIQFGSWISELNFCWAIGSRFKSILGIEWWNFGCRILRIIIRIFCHCYHRCQMILVVIAARP